MGNIGQTWYPTMPSSRDIKIPIFSLWKWSVFDISIYLSFYFKEKEKLLQEIKDKEEDLQYEKEIQEALDVKIKAIESKILRGSQNIDNSSKWKKTEGVKRENKWIGRQGLKITEIFLSLQQDNRAHRGT